MSLYATININTTNPELNVETDIFQGIVRDAVQNIISEVIGKTAHENDSIVITDKEEMRRIAKELYEQNKYEYILTVEENDEQVDYSFAELLRPDFRGLDRQFVDIEDSPLAPRTVRIASRLNDDNFMQYVSLVSRGEVLFGRRIKNIESIELELQ